jgi:hypothetical protein
VQPPYTRTRGGERIELRNNDEAEQPTWAELLLFLASDRTDEKPYSLESYPCGAFAEEVHNNAEAAGITAAFVALAFQDGSEGHALNAFDTIDRGLVFVDCTSSYRSDRSSESPGDPAEGEDVGQPSGDTIAYVRVGEEYGLIGADIATSPDYAYYVEYLAKRLWLQEETDAFNVAAKAHEAQVESFNRDVDAYNLEVAAYREELGGRTTLEEPEYSKFTTWAEHLRVLEEQLADKSVGLRLAEAGLDSIAEGIRAVEEEIGLWSWVPLGVVSSVEIYW